MKLLDKNHQARADYWIKDAVLANCGNWNRQSSLPIRRLIGSLSEADLLVPGWPAPFGDGDVRKQIYLHYALARQPVGGVGLCVLSHIDIGARMLLEKASAPLAEQWLPRALTGEAVFSLAMTEPMAGSDLQGLQFTAEKCGSGWVLNGVKRGITNLPFADVAIVLARTKPGRSPFSYSLFLLPLNIPGITREAALPTLGYSGCLGGFKAEDAVTTDEHLIGPVGGGLILLMQHLEVERLFVGARMLGVSDYIYDCLTHTYGSTSPYCSHSRGCAELKVQLNAYRSFFDHCVDKFVRGALSAKDSASLKYLGSRLLKALTSALSYQSGLDGFLKDHPAEQCGREALGLALAGGSEEVMLTLIGSAL